MNEKDKKLSIQKMLSIFNSIFLYCFLLLAVWVAVSKVNYSVFYCTYFIVLSSVILLDILFSQKEYFKHLLLCIIQKNIMYVLAVLGFCFMREFVDWEGILLVFAVYTLFALFFCFELDKNVVKIIVGIVNALLFITFDILAYIFVKRSSSIFAYVLSDIAASVVMIVTFIYLNKMILAMEKRIFSKDRIIEKAKDDYNNLELAQDKLITLNEQLNAKRMEQEILNQKISRSNNEMIMQYSVIKYISSTLEMDKIITYTTESIKESLSVAVCSILVVDENSGKIYSSLDTYLGEDFKKEFYDYYVPEGVISPRLRREDKMINNRITAESAPLLEKYGIGSVYICPIGMEGFKGIMLVGTTGYDYFKDNLYFFDTIVAQLNIAITHSALYIQLLDAVDKDGLSKIYNRRYLSQYVENIKNNIDKYEKVAIVIMDIDNFKRINDKYGHVKGDEVIKRCAFCADINKDDADIIAGRYGGEEFAIVYRNKSREDVMKNIEHIHHMIRNSSIYSEDLNEDIVFDVSIGVAMYPEDCSEMEQLLICADRALYHSKNNGKGCITYYRNGTMVKDKYEIS